MSQQEGLERMNQTQFPGSRWWKFDFHTHTPKGSSDYRGDKSISAADWLTHHKNRHIDCVVITDHNGGEWLDTLKEQLSQFKQTNSDWKNFFVLPGVEINCSSGVHVLAVLSSESTSKNIAALVGKCGYQGTLGNSDAVTTTSALEVMKIIQGSPWNGLAIAAHVDCEKGLFKSITDTHTLADVLQTVDALQVVDENQLDELVKDDTCKKRLAEIAHVQGSDSHDSQAAPKDSFTWVKMTEPSLEGLKLALAEPQLSVRRSSQAPDGLPKSWIESLEMAGLHKRRRSLKVTFNPWLNTVIGGRGSGKSSIVECLRLALGRGKEAEQQLGAAHEVSQSIAQFSETMVLQCSKLSAVTHGAGDLGGVYRFEWAKNEADRGISRPGLDDDTPWIKTEIKHTEVLDSFPVRLFSQKQIHALANQPEGLLGYLDSSLTDGQSQKIQQLKGELGAAVNRLNEARDTVRTMEDGLRLWPATKDQLAQVIESLTQYTQQGIHDKLLSLQQLRTEKRAFKDFHEGIQSDVIALTQALSSVQINEWSVNLPPNASPEAKALASVWNTSFLALREAWARITSQASLLHQHIEGLKTEASFLTWNTKNHAEEEQCLSALEAVKMQLGGQLQQVGFLQQKKEDLEKQNALFEANANELSSAKALVAQRYQEMVSAREAITKARQDFVDTITRNAPEETLKITLLCAAQYNQKCADELRQLLGLNTAEYANVFLGNLDDDESKGVLATLARNPKRLDELKKAVEAFVQSGTNETRKILDTDLGGERAHIRSALKSISQQKLDELWTWFPEDKVEVQFRQNVKDKWQDISEGSAGQKTGALLSFILNEGEEPLILDQPEDDLDNENVSKLVVEQLRQSKSRRQIIVVTHNANIVVNGDAELVIPMAFRGGQIQMDTIGGLQDIAIRQKVCEVMEGGEKAFRNRYKRVLEDLPRKA